MARFFDPRIERRSDPAETHLRLPFRQFRYRLGFESLGRGVSDSISAGRTPAWITAIDSAQASLPTTNRARADEDP
ncbi:putative transposase [Mycobacterium kansasii 662]|uniref:Uncharacterized protein n=3 Tax=Mycobacterium kansasii TaxID=1768 RepID=U5WYD2_MYCKA|nr:hypothetical protein MKAN_03405 [Mycobacterium kansasii ATCC 12478]EUA00545.1 putative transposase [Mycobacterium kansasii 824]EUA18693.1 putative transposase [Mycobacterium kansasii 662]KEP41292.1 hypothetical protein MKSMC1_37130 [Mycobacterium kansasii]KZS71035.1 hypothetical protein A4G30_03110 [Mycobacterium kansasii]